MQVSLANGSLASLVELGRRHGELTAADLQQFLPIEAMSSREIARAISNLEDQGIEITVDQDFLVSRPRSLTQLQADEVGSAYPMQGPERKSQTADHAAERLPTREAPEQAPAGRLETICVAIAGLMVCAVAILLFWTWA